jgi:predicted DNA-binding transcriptional regulator AlpA
MSVGPTTKQRYRQPLEVLQLPAALLRLETLAAASGLSLSSLYRRAAAGELPLVRLGSRCTRVRSSDARAFIEHLGGTHEPQ